MRLLPFFTYFYNRNPYFLPSPETLLASLQSMTSSLLTCQTADIVQINTQNLINNIPNTLYKRKNMKLFFQVPVFHYAQLSFFSREILYPER